MAAVHGWRECRPALVVHGPAAAGRRVPADVDRSVRVQAILDRVWPEVPEADRRAFHAFCCHNEHTPANTEAMRRIAAQLSAAGLGG